MAHEHSHRCGHSQIGGFFDHHSRLERQEDGTGPRRKDAPGKSSVLGSSLIELVLKEITGALGRGDTLRLSWFESGLPYKQSLTHPGDADSNTGKPGPVSHREMVFRPKPRVGKEMAEPAQHSIRGILPIHR